VLIFLSCSKKKQGSNSVQSGKNGFVCIF